MKRNICFFCTVLLYMAITQISRAQCKFENPGVELNNVSTSGANCLVNLDLKFTINRNNGNKYTYIHLWKESEHPTIDYKSGGAKGPNAAELGPVLATIAIEWKDANVAKLMSTYSPSPTLIYPLYTGVNISQENTGDLYTVTVSNLSFVIPGACTDIPLLKGDVWGTQAQSTQPAIHCSYAGFLLTIDDPTVTGTINCNGTEGPRTYNLDITSTGTLNIVYKVYIDNGDKIFNSADGAPIFTSGVTAIGPSSPVDINAASYSYATDQSQRSLWVEVSGGSLPNSIIKELANNCLAPLPVKLTKFKGELLDESVALSWITTEEAGSLAFDVQRSTNLQEFSTIGRVSAAGHSDVTRIYSFLDDRPVKGINYYRLKQVDLDGSFENSRVISVANEANSLSFVLMGNPVQDKDIKFLLSNGDVNNLKLTDIRGRDIHFGLIQSDNIYSIRPAQILPTGLYILSLKNGQRIESRKVLVH
jgi:hypothetical protein